MKRCIKWAILTIKTNLSTPQNYALEISKLAARGVKLIVLPERAININKETDAASFGLLSTCA